MLIVLPARGIGQEIPEGGDALVSKEQSRLFRDKKRIESLFFEATKAKITDNPGQALRLFKELIDIEPTHDASWFELGLLYYRMRDINNAISYTLKAYQLKPDNVWYSLTLATLYSHNSQLEEASKIYSDLHKKDPSDRQYAMELANILIKLEKNDEALSLYNEIEKKEGLSEEISLRKHHIYLAEGKKKKAQEELEKLADTYEWDSRVQSLLAEYYMMNGMDTKALETYKKILTIDPENPYINISLADYYRKKGNLKESVAALKKGFANQYLDANTKLQILSTYYSQMDSYPEMENDIVELSDILVQHHPYEPMILAFRADLLAMKQQYPEALAIYNQVSELDPSKYEVWESILRLTAMSEKYDSLIIKSQKVIELFPVQPLPYYFKSIGHLMLKDHGQAIKTINTGMKLVFNNNALMAEFHSLHGDALHGENRNQEAFNAYENSLRYNPDNPLVLNNYAYYLALEEKNLDKAVEMAEKANTLSPDNPTFLDTYAWTLYKRGQYAEALVPMEKAIKLQEKPGAVEMEHYGDILYKLGMVNEAKNWWEQANKIGGGSSLLQQKVTEGKLYE